MSNIILERARSSVRSNEIGKLLYGGKENLDRLKEIWIEVENDPEFSKFGRYLLNHTHRYIDACRKVKRFVEYIRKNNITNLDKMYELYLAIDENLPIDVHLSMFIPLLEYHTNANQKDKWLPLAKSFSIIGAYAQTELGHGSNVRGIATTATFDKQTNEFIINTPNQSAMKWWPGGLAHTATHAVVYAKLIIDSKSYGPHSFLVQLRDLSNHQLLPGIETGDIGSKLGYNSMDNGYAIFRSVRVPRDQMLMGYAQVSASGQYSKQPGAEKIAYGIMLDVRTRICTNSAYALARALVIAVRYR